MNNQTSKDVLVCRDLAVGYKGKSVLAGLNLAFEPGHFISLLGPNGAGKTTLLRTLSRHLQPLDGHIEILGKPLASMPSLELARIMAVVLTDKISPPLFKVFEFVALGRYPHTDFLGRLKPADCHTVKKALEAVNAEDLAARPFSDLSDGERQKALVARALAQQPKIMLLDEPTIHLDLKHRVEVMTILRNLCRTRGITVVASLHDVDVAAKVSDRVALIKNGRISAWGSPEEVLTGRAVADLYDFHGAEFNSLLGSIELRGNGHKGRAFVVASMGSGAMVYRILAKRGFAITTGVLHTNDLDYYVARSLGAECTSQPPMETIHGDSVSKAKKQMDFCDVIIDCGFETGALNQGNIKILRKALRMGKPFFSLRDKGQAILAQESIETPLVRRGSITRLIETLDQWFPSKIDNQHADEKTREAS